MILECAKSGNVKRLKERLSTIEDRDIKTNLVNQGDKEGRTALWWASWNDYGDIAHFLLKCGARVDKASSNGFTPLIVCSAKGNLECFKTLISHGADISLLEKQGADATYIAVQERHLDIVDYAIGIEKGLANRKTIKGRTPIFMAVKRRHLQMCKHLFAKGADLNIQDNYGLTPTLMAIVVGDIDILKWMTENGGIVRQTSRYGMNAVVIGGRWSQNHIREYLRKFK